MEKDFKPNLFIIGAAKCGTTSLYDYLETHPDVYMCQVKEPHFFAHVESKKSELYEPPEPEKKYHNKVIRSLEVYESLFDKGAGYKIRGEASPSYLFDSTSALKIYNYNSAAKIITILRNPVDRAFSHFQMDIARGVQKNVSFNEAIKEDFRKPESQKIWGKSYMYVDLGLYFVQIKRYFDVFPKQKLLILVFEKDIIKNFNETSLRIQRFLEVSKASLDSNIKSNEGYTPKSVLFNRILKNKSIKKFVFRFLPLKVVTKFKGRFLSINRKKNKDQTLKLGVGEKQKIFNEFFLNDVKQLEALLNISFEGIWY